MGAGGDLASHHTGSLFSYDVMGRVIGLWACAPATCGTGYQTARPMSFAYDWAGNLTQETDNVSGTISFGRSIAGEVTSITEVALGIDVSQQVSAGNWAGVAYDAGLVVGGAAGGYFTGGAVANGIKPGASSGWSFARDVANRYIPGEYDLYDESGSFDLPRLHYVRSFACRGGSH